MPTSRSRVLVVCITDSVSQWTQQEGPGETSKNYVTPKHCQLDSKSFRCNHIHIQDKLWQLVSCSFPRHASDLLIETTSSSRFSASQQHFYRPTQDITTIHADGQNRTFPKMKSIVVSMSLLAATMAVSAQIIQSRPFSIRLNSEDKSVDGQYVGACHSGAAIESLCLSSRPVTMHFNTTTNETDATGLLTWYLPGSAYILNPPSPFHRFRPGANFDALRCKISRLTRPCASSPIPPAMWHRPCFILAISMASTPSLTRTATSFSSQASTIPRTLLLLVNQSPSTAGTFATRTLPDTDTKPSAGSTAILALRTLHASRSRWPENSTESDERLIKQRRIWNSLDAVSAEWLMESPVMMRELMSHCLPVKAIL